MARWDVYIDGQGFILDPEYGDDAYTEDPQDPHKDTLGENIWRNWTMRSFHGGERQKVLLAEKDLENYQYHEAEGLRIDEFGKVTLQPELALDLAVKSKHLPMLVTYDGARVILGLEGSPFIKVWYNGTWSNASSVAGSGAVTDLCQIGSVLYAVRGGKVITSTNNGNTWSEVKYTPRRVTSVEVTSGGSDYATAPTVVIESEKGSGATATATVSGGKVTAIAVISGGSGYDDAPIIRIEGGGGTGASAYAVVGLGSETEYSTASCLATVNQDLYVGFTGGGVFNHSKSVFANTTSVPTSMAGFMEDIFWVEDRRLWRWNGQVSFEFDTLPSGFVGTLLFPYRSALFIMGYYKEQGGYKNACYYVWQSAENHLVSWGDYTADHRASAACGSDDEVWYSVAARGGADRYDFTYGGLTCGPAWGEHGNIPYKAMAYADGYFFCGRYDNKDVTDGVYVADLSSPSTYNTSGWLVTSEWDFDFPDDEKILRSVAVYHLPLEPDQAIEAEYSLDGGGSWRTCGISKDVGTTRMVWTFPNIRFDTIKLRITLLGPGTSTPTLRKVLVRACALSEAKMMWKMRLIADRVASKSGRTRRGYAAIEKLREIYQSQLPVPFVDRIGRSHMVLLKDAPMRQTAYSKRSAYIYVELLEL